MHTHTHTLQPSAHMFNSCTFLVKGLRGAYCTHVYMCMYTGAETRPEQRESRAFESLHPPFGLGVNRLTGFGYSNAWLIFSVTNWGETEITNDGDHRHTCIPVHTHCVNKETLIVSAHAKMIRLPAAVPRMKACMSPVSLSCQRFRFYVEKRGSLIFLVEFWK